MRLLHPQDRVLAGGRQQVSDEGPVSPSANWQFRPVAGSRPKFAKRPFNPPDNKMPQPLDMDVFVAEAKFRAPNVLAQLTHCRGVQPRISAGVHRFFIAGRSPVDVQAMFRSDL